MTSSQCCSLKNRKAELDEQKEMERLASLPREAPPGLRLLPEAERLETLAALQQSRACAAGPLTERRKVGARTDVRQLKHDVYDLGAPLTRQWSGTAAQRG